jgi:hypothetical protein
MFNLHYQANGKASTDKTRVGLWLAKGPITHASQGPGGGDFGNETFIVNGKELTGRFSAQVTQDILPPGLKTVPNIPAGADNYTLVNLLPIRRETVVYASSRTCTPRKSMKYTPSSGWRRNYCSTCPATIWWQIVYEYETRRCLREPPSASSSMGQLNQEQVQPEAGPGGLLGRAKLGRDAQPDHPRRGEAAEPGNPNAACASVAAVVLLQRGQR